MRPIEEEPRTNGRHTAWSEVGSTADDATSTGMGLTSRNLADLALDGSVHGGLSNADGESTHGSDFWGTAVRSAQVNAAGEGAGGHSKYGKGARTAGERWKQVAKNKGKIRRQSSQNALQRGFKRRGSGYVPLLVEDVDGFSCIVNPDSTLYSKWFSLTVVLTILFAFIMPARVAFGEDSGTFQRDSILLWLETIIDIMFAVDVVLNFFVAYTEYNHLVTDLTSIAFNYLRLKFWIDLLACVPWALVLGSMVKDKGGLLALDMLRLCRFLRMERVARMVFQLETNFKYNFIVVALAKFCFLLVLSGHLSGCGLFLIARQEGFGDNTWVGVYDPGLPEEPAYVQYVTSVYWAFTTLTTVGYGDYSPVGIGERVFGIFVMILNVGLSSYILGNMTLLATKRDATTAQHRTKKEELHTFMKLRNIPDELCEAALSHLQLSWDLSQDRDDVLMNCPSFIRIKVLRYLYKESVVNAHLFVSASDQFVDRLLSLVTVEFFFPNVYVLNAGDEPDAFYCILEGSVDVYDGTVKRRRLRKGQMFGEEALLCDFPQPWTIRTAAMCRMLAFKREAWRSLAEKLPRDARACQMKVKDWLENQLLNGGTLNIEPDPLAHEVVAMVQSGIAKNQQDLITSLCYAASKGDTREVRRLVQGSDMDTNEGDYDGRCAIHLSAAGGHYETTQFLLESGSRPSLQDNFGTTPLMEAVNANKHDVAELLRTHGAELLVKDLGGVLCELAFSAKVEKLEAMLRYGADPDAADYDGRRGLHLAAAEGILPAVSLFLRFKADVNVRDRWGHSALDEATQAGHKHVEQVLLNAGARQYGGSGEDEVDAMLKAEEQANAAGAGVAT